MRFEFSAGVVVYTNAEDGRRFLALKKVGEGRLDAPKGHIEKGEDARSAAIRETFEESGLRVELDPYFKDRVEYWFVQDKEKIKKGVTYYLARVEPDAKVRVSKEHVGYEWIKLGDAKLFKDYEELLGRADDYIDKQGEMEILNDEYSDLPNALKRWELGRNFVPGDGPVNARIMVVGQAPGRSEDAKGKPFVGMAGKLLTSLLKKAGLDRSDVYITSVVQFFPPDNRVPTTEEANLCLPFLKKQIQIVKPQVIVLLGNFATYSLYGAKEVMKIHGYMIKSNAYGCELFVTLHPAAAVRMKKHLPIIEKDFVKLGKLLEEKGLH